MQLFNTKKHLISREVTSALLSACKKGDSRAQKAVYDSLSGKMYALCVRYMGDRESAQDVLQDGFVNLFSKLDSYSGEGSFEGWARKIFVNTALMSLRKNDILRQSEDIDSAWSIEGGEPSAIDNISCNEIIRLVSALPEGFRTVFNMYVVEGYSHKEIADALGISEATSRSQLMRARLILQDKIKKM